MSPLENVTIKDKEFLDHFMVSGFPVSKMTYHIDNKIDFAQHNMNFLELGIPYICLSESEMTDFPIMGKKYYYVPKECATLDPSNPAT
jgi:hypothetical protein